MKFAIDTARRDQIAETLMQATAACGALAGCIAAGATLAAIV